MDILHYIGGPLIGAAIGYCTNYIAVKMLFRPTKEIRIGRFTVPFTPGIIPKRKNDLAAAVGKAVGNALLTEKDLAGMLLTSDMENSVADLCMVLLDKYMAGDNTVGNMVTSLTGAETYIKGRTAIQEKVSGKVMQALVEMEPGKLIAEEGKKAIRQKLSGNVLGKLLSDSLLDSFAREIGAYAENYIMENGPQMIGAQIEKEIAGMEEKPLKELGEQLPLERNAVRERICVIYRACITKFAASIAEQFHIADIVEEKIRSMDVMELERLVMSVMEHELGMIVNLGALIGLLLGVFNLLF